MVLLEEDLDAAECPNFKLVGGEVAAQVSKKITKLQSLVLAL